MTVRVTDEDGTHDIAGPRVGVLNAPPRLHVAGAGSARPGEAYTLTLSSAPGADRVRFWFVDWGDGSPEQAVRPAEGGGATVVAHAFPAPPAGRAAKTYSVRVKALDDDGDGWSAVPVVPAGADSPSPSPSPVLFPAGGVDAAQAVDRRRHNKHQEHGAEGAGPRPTADVGVEQVRAEELVDRAVVAAPEVGGGAGGEGVVHELPAR